jgi:hypothetical protein
MARFHEGHRQTLLKHIALSKHNDWSGEASDLQEILAHITAPETAAQGEGQEALAYLNDNGVLILPSEQSHQRAGWLVAGSTPKDSWVPLVPASELAALRAQLAERDEHLAKARECIAIYDAIVARKDEKLAASEARERELVGLAKECSDYLNTNNLTSIGHGSVLHRKLQDAALASRTGGQQEG